MASRVSQERVMEMIDYIEAEDRHAEATGAAHGNYGEDFGAVVFDLFDARRELAVQAEALEALAAALETLRVVLKAWRTCGGPDSVEITYDALDAALAAESAPTSPENEDA